MSSNHTNGRLLSDLRDSGSTPSASNSLYEGNVQDWCWWELGELGIWNGKPKCHCLDSWVQDFSFRFKEYAKKIWKGSFHNLKSANKVWFEKPIEFPQPVECKCADDENENENIEVKITFSEFEFAL